MLTSGFIVLSFISVTAAAAATTKVQTQVALAATPICVALFKPGASSNTKPLPISVTSGDKLLETSTVDKLSDKSLNKTATPPPKNKVKAPGKTLKRNVETDVNMENVQILAVKPLVPGGGMSTPASLGNSTPPKTPPPPPKTATTLPTSTPGGKQDRPTKFHPGPVQFVAGGSGSCGPYDTEKVLGACLWGGLDETGADPSKAGWLSSSATDLCNQEIKVTRAGSLTAPVIVVKLLDNCAFFAPENKDPEMGCNQLFLTKKAFLDLSPSAGELADGDMKGLVWDFVDPSKVYK